MAGKLRRDVVVFAATTFVSLCEAYVHFNLNRSKWRFPHGRELRDTIVVVAIFAAISTAIVEWIDPAHPDGFDQSGAVGDEPKPS